MGSCEQAENQDVNRLSNFTVSYANGEVAPSQNNQPRTDQAS